MNLELSVKKVFSTARKTVSGEIRDVYFEGIGNVLKVQKID